MKLHDNVKKLFGQYSTEHEITSMEAYSKGFEAGSTIQVDEVMTELSKAPSEEEALNDDYRMGLFDGALEVARAYLDKNLSNADNRAA